MGIATIGKTVFFSASDGPAVGLWKTDGTGAGTSKLADVSPTRSDVVVGSELFFVGIEHIGKVWFGERDVIESNDRLIKSGASIGEINCVRKHLSAIKGGRLGARVRGRSVTLIYSDVSSGALAAACAIAATVSMAIASASRMTRRSAPLNGVHSSLGTARNLKSLRPSFLPTAELTFIQKGQPTRAAARISPS